MCVCVISAGTHMNATYNVLHADYKQQQQHYHIPVRSIQLETGSAIELAPSSMHASHTPRAAGESVRESEQTSEGMPRCVSTKIFEWVVQEGDICMKLVCGDGAYAQRSGVSDHVQLVRVSRHLAERPQRGIQNSDGAPVPSIGSSESRVPLTVTRAV